MNGRSRTTLIATVCALFLAGGTSLAADAVLTGRVYEGTTGTDLGDGNPPTTAIANVTVALYGSNHWEDDPNTSQFHWLRPTTTDSGGAYGLTVYDTDAYDYFNIVETNKAGYIDSDPPGATTAPGGGAVRSPNWIQYTREQIFGRSPAVLTGNKFWDQPAAPAENHPPVADPKSATTSEDKPVQIILTGSDPDGNPITDYQVRLQPHDGTLSGTVPNLTYTPDKDYSGQDSFTYRVSDGQLWSSDATVTISIRAVNDPPVARNDSYSAVAGQTRNVPTPGVLDNDTDPEDDPLTAAQATGPSHGSLTLNSNGSFTYTPYWNYTGPDSFTYTASDIHGATATATVFIEVAGPPPGTGVIKGVKFNDVDQEGDYDQDELGLNGWTIYLERWELAGGGISYAWNPIGDTTTTNGGQYSFGGLPAGKYRVSEKKENNWVQSYPQSGVWIVTLTDGQVVDHQDFGNHLPSPILEEEEGDYGDAPEDAVAYPGRPGEVSVMGHFPTCRAAGSAGSFILHRSSASRYFGYPGDSETDGNGGQCAFPPYDQDESFKDGDAGLSKPDAYTISSGGKVSPCVGTGQALGKACGTAIWGFDIDIDLNKYFDGDAYVNVLIDWNQDGWWGGESLCPDGGKAPEHVLENFVMKGRQQASFPGLAGEIPAGFRQFRIGPNSGYVWARFTISEKPVPQNWNGSGTFDEGETEDYLLRIDPADGEAQYDYGDAPAPYKQAWHDLGGPYAGLVPPDAESLTQATVPGWSDEANADADEDGVTFVGSFARGQVVRISAGATAFGTDLTFGLWIDLDHDKDWDDPDEDCLSTVGGKFPMKFMGKVGAPPGKVDRRVLVFWWIPSDAPLGKTYLRFRVYEGFVPSPSPIGYGGPGEVEDYEIEIKPASGEIPPAEVIPTGGMIFGEKWNDLNGNGLWDQGETGWPGWTILLTDNPSGKFGPTSLSTTTDENGYFQFTGLKPGTYVVGEKARADCSDCRQTFPGSPATHTVIVSEPPASTGPGLQAWVVPYVRFGNTQDTVPGPGPGTGPFSIKFNDLDGDGVKDPDEPGLAGWEFQFECYRDGYYCQPVTSLGGPSVWTDGDGLFTVPDDTLCDCGFKMWEVPQQGWVHTYYEALPDGTYIFGNHKTTDEYDYGDAPLGQHPSGAPFKYGVARHKLVAGSPYLGTVPPDAEPGVQPIPPGWGDDDNNPTGTPDDEDGVTIPPFEPTDKSVTATIVASGAGYLNAWLDFDDNGDWTGTGEQIFKDLALSQGSNSCTFTVPGSAKTGYTYARFRFSTKLGVGSSGLADDGEVEDYLVTIGTPSPGPTVLGPDEIGVYKWVDNNGDGKQKVDEFDVGLDAWGFWLDTNNNGVKDAGEPEGKTTSMGFFTFTGLAPGTYVVHEALVPGWTQTVPGNNGTYTVTLPLPAGQTNTNKPLPFGNQQTGGPGPGGIADYGDAPTKTQSGFANSYPDAWHSLGGPYAGIVPPDAEAQSQNTAGADGDDLNNDDEDGFSLQNYLVVGQAVHVEGMFTRLDTTVATSVGLWIDLNRDGVWQDDSSERRTGGLSPGAPTGLYFILAEFTVPSNVKPGLTYARLRVVDGPEASLSPGGAGGPGEVEDHVIEIKAAGSAPPNSGVPPAGGIPPGGLIIYTEKWQNLKWSQPVLEIDPKVEQTPVFCGWDEPAFSIQTSARQRRWNMVADDFHCLGPIPVTSVRWWGSFAGWTADTLPSVAPTAFHIGVWTGVPPDTTYPWGRPEELVWETTADEWTWEFAGYEQSASGAGTSGPSTGLVAHWKLDGDAKDNAGTSHGVVRGNPVWATGKVGEALQFDGVDDYVELPIGAQISQLTSSTFALWVNWSAGGGPWQRVFDFGKGTNAYMFLSPSAGPGGPLRFAITTAGNAAEQQVTAPTALAGGWHHVAVVIDAAAHSMRLYLDGNPVAANTAATLTPSALGQTTQNWLGRSQYPGDAYYQGLIDEMRVYNRALSAEEIKSLIGPQQQTQETCFEFNCDLPTEDWFHQERFETEQEVFWLSITALYPGSSEGSNPWGWLSRPVGWENGAVRFEQTGAQLQPGLVLAPQGMTLVHDEGVCGSVQDYDMAFELRTDPAWIRWDEPFTGIRDWPSYDDHASFATEATDGTLTIVQQVADDWAGASGEAPLIALAWEGSYIGYGYEACRCGPTEAPRRPNYFQVVIRANLPPDAANPLDRPGNMVWAYEVFDYDEVLVGYDRHPSGEPNEPVFRYSARLPRDKWFWHEGQRVYWLSIMAVYVGRADQIKYPWGWTDHEHQFGSTASKLSASGRGLVREPLSDPTGGLIDMSFTLYTTSESRPVAHWGFDEATGNIAVDSVGGHNGTIHGATWTTGAAGGALRFDGGDYVEVPDEAAFDITDAITVAAWVNLEAVSAEYIGVVTKGDSTWRLSTLQAQRRFHFAVNDSQGAFHAVDGTTGVRLNEWHHVVGTYDGTALRLYVDGVEEATSPVAYTGPIHVDDFPVWIGANAERSGRGFVGRIDDVWICDRALTKIEVLELMAMADDTTP